MPMRIADAPATARLLPYGALVEALRGAAAELARGAIRCPQRQVIAIDGGGAVLSMLAVGADLAVHKLVTVVPGNRDRGLPTIHAGVTVWDVATGAPLLALDGAIVTARRTAALSMLGIQALLPHRPRSVWLTGTGVQARHHVEALTEIFPEARISVAGRTPGASERFCAGHAHLGAALTPSRVATVTDDVDVYIACTTSREPVYREPARADRLLIAVGAFSPDAAEIDAETVRASRLYVDDPIGARDEAGDLIRAGIDWTQVHPLAAALGDGAPPHVPVLLKTVGNAAWDLAAARVAVRGSPG
jgi:1-piperideine-2-carboxylate/1-pyrroline-2-carboxylate reductase [NAD(P)H]